MNPDKTYKKLVFSVLLAMIAVSGGCSTAVDVPAEHAEQPISILWQADGNFSPLPAAARLVVRSQADLAKLTFPALPVNFDVEMLLIATMNQQPAGGSKIRITRVYSKGHRIHAEVHRYYPDAEKPKSTGPSRPFHVVAIPRSDFNVEGFVTDLSAYRSLPFNPYR